MPKNNSIPTAILSFVQKSNSRDNGDDNDHAFLLPSNGSSFNLAGDAGYSALSKSASHQSNNSGKSSKEASNASSSSGGGHRQRHHHRRHSSSGGERATKKKRSSQRNRDLDKSLSHDSYSSHLSERTSSSVSTHTNAKSSNRSPRHRRKHSLQNNFEHEGGRHEGRGISPKKYEGHHTGPFPEIERGHHQGRNSSSKNDEKQHTTAFPESKNRFIPLKQDPSMGENGESGHLLGYDSDTPRALATIAASSSFHSDSSKRDGNISPSIDTIHSGRTYRTQKSAIPNRSGRSSRRRAKLEREKKRLEWIRRWRKQRLMETTVLTVVYSLLFAFTLLVTLGPLALNSMDPVDWCPYYHDDLWDASHHGENKPYDSGYALNVDQLQQSRGQRQQEVGNEQLHRRKLISQVSDLKKTEIDMLRRALNDANDNNSDRQSDSQESKPKYENPDYDDSPCHITRIPFLFYLTLEECDLSRRMAASVLLGGLIGYERRASDRPAGVRTMALVALGSCFFTISSQLTFRDSPMPWDASRVTAAIPSGVGFLGAGLIWKGSLSDGSGNELQQVHGITTAASVWLAAAVGAGTGGALYAVSAYSAALVILVLRFGPRLYLQNDRGFEDDDGEEEDEKEDGEEDIIDEKNYGKSAVPTHAKEDTRIIQNVSTFETHKMGHATNDATALKTDAAKYGAVDIEGGLFSLYQQDERRQPERLNRLGGNDSRPSTDDGRQSGNITWLTKLLVGKGRQPPPNPYQEVTRNREVMRIMMRKMKKKKNLGNLDSRPSFCT